MHRKADVYQRAYDDYLQSLAKDPANAGALDGLVRTALITKQTADAAAVLKKAGVTTPEQSVAISKLLAAAGDRDEALVLARGAVTLSPQSPMGLEQLASLYADSGDTVQLDATVSALRTLAPNRAATEFYAAVAAFLHGDANETVVHAERAIAIDPAYAATYDLIGAAYTRLGRLDPARQAFQKSLSFDAHDSTAYENLGVLELNAGNRALAAKHFAEALWLVPDSRTARHGLAQAQP